MSFSQKIFLLILSLSLILCNEVNNKKETHSKKDDKDNPNSNLTKDDSSEDVQFNETEPFTMNMTKDEMDIIMFCTVIVQESLRKQKNEIEKFSKKLNFNNSNPLFDKIGTDFFETCYKKINIKTVNQYVENLTFIKEFKWEKEFDEYTKLDEKKYKNESDLNFSIEQHLLMQKFRKVNEIFDDRRMERNERISKENKKIRIGKIDMESIPMSFKVGIFLVILLLFFGGIFYFLKTLNKKPKDTRKKEKKKKTQ